MVKCKGYIPAPRQDVRELRSVSNNSFTRPQMLLGNSMPKCSSSSMVSEIQFPHYPASDSSQISARYVKGRETLPHLAELNLHTTHYQATQESNLATAFLRDGIKVGSRSAYSLPNLIPAQPIEPSIMTMTGVQFSGPVHKLTGP